jgi:hypothetical protein
LDVNTDNDDVIDVENILLTSFIDMFLVVCAAFFG